MKYMIIIFSLVSVVTGFLAFYASGDYIIGIVVGILFLGYFIFAIKKFLEKYIKEVEKVHECYFFINNFIISLSVQNSMQAAYEKVETNATSYLKEVMEHIDHLSIKDRLNYLKEYFNYDLYFHFVNVLDLYEEQGGNILNMSKLLLEENTRCENSINESIKIGRGKIIEFTVLWVITYLILGVARFAISNFFEMIQGIVIYKIAICLFFSLVLFSIHLMIMTYKNVCVKKEKVYA